MALYELENIKQSYNEKEVLNIEKLSLDPKQIIGFFGPNGSGKSTLFSLLAFVKDPSSGILKYEGIDSNKLSFQEKQSVVLVPQNPYLLKRSVFENISYGLKLRKHKGDLGKVVKEALKLVGLDKSFSKRKYNELSGGEAQRVSLAARLILKPKVLILDEPTSGIDVNSAQLIKEAILISQQKYNTSILISSHDHNWLNHICDKKIALLNGRVVQSGNINLLFAPWQKNKNGDLVKKFLDGQNLVLKNTKDKKRNSVVLINSNDISFVSNIQDALRVKVNSIIAQNNSDKVLLELYIGGIVLNKQISQEELKHHQIYAGSIKHIKISSTNISWL
ncbi:MAG: hypothetical protein CR967_01755 [Proteobacteria bacterium]|nr:MAG: hypothetical protein CR967_01755 [Pseudomonadota bacterium]